MLTTSGSATNAARAPRVGRHPPLSFGNVTEISAKLWLEKAQAKTHARRCVRTKLQCETVALSYRSADLHVSVKRVSFLISIVKGCFSAEVKIRNIPKKLVCVLVTHVCP